MIHPSINNRNTIGKIKELLRWNREEYTISTPAENDGVPSRPPRQKKASRNSVAPSEKSEIKVIPSATSMHVNDIENIDEVKRKDEENHIWQHPVIVLQFNTQNYQNSYYNIPYAIPYSDWLTSYAQWTIKLKALFSSAQDGMH